MIILMEEDEFLNELRTFGCVDRQEITEDGDFTFRLWDYKGEPCVIPTPHPEGNGKQYCRRALGLFFKTLDGVNAEQRLVKKMAYVARE